MSIMVGCPVGSANSESRIAESARRRARRVCKERGKREMEKNDAHIDAFSRSCAVPRRLRRLRAPPLPTALLLPGLPQPPLPAVLSDNDYVYLYLILKCRNTFLCAPRLWVPVTAEGICACVYACTRRIMHTRRRAGVLNRTFVCKANRLPGV